MPQALLLCSERGAERSRISAAQAPFRRQRKASVPMDQPSDIRNLSARRPGSASVVELRSPAQLRPDLREAIAPVQRRFGRPQQVIREHTNNAVRWKPGERLNHLLEAASLRLSATAAVVPDAGTLPYRELACRAHQLAPHLL